jgi:hypothetical protein
VQDLIAKGEAWFEQQRRQHLAVTVEYRPIGALLPRTCRATLVVGRWESISSTGQVVRMETRDFFIHTDELPQDPKRGDKIAANETGVERIYDVAIPEGAKSPWAWADRKQTTRRIHTMATTATQAQQAILLVRLFGSSAAAEITDTQIKSQLTAEMVATPAMTRQVTAASSYVYIVMPTSFVSQSLTFKINGFVSTAWERTDRAMVFDGQASQSYSIFRSTYAITGNVMLEVA